MSPLAIAAIFLLLFVIGAVAVHFIRTADYRRRVVENPMPSDSRPPSDEDVVRLARAGQKIEAIRIYRQIHRVGLKEAKDAVEAIERVGFQNHGEMVSTPSPGEAAGDREVERLARLGNKIAAIKLYREIHGGNLAEAKRAVEEIVDFRNL